MPTGPHDGTAIRPRSAGAVHQGKSCFNFAEVDKALFGELATLTRAGFASYKTQGLV